MPRRRLAFLAAIVGALAAFAACIHMTDMPGESQRGALPDPDLAETDLARELEADVRALAEEIGERNHLHPEALARAADHVARALAAAGLESRREAYQAEGQTFENLVAEVLGTARPDEIVVVGAHYDSVAGSPGANDNASGVAAVLALARRFARSPCARTLRFAAFANEEPPWFQGDAMGSLVHARGALERGERVVAMLSLETIGYYSDEEGSQELPAPGLGLLYPSVGNFIAFVGDLGSRELVREAIEAFRATPRSRARAPRCRASSPASGGRTTGRSARRASPP